MPQTRPAARRQADRSRHTREHVLSATVGLIRMEGLSSASPVRITRQSGMSWGAVQHHFGSKEELLKTIVRRSRDQFQQAVGEQEYAGLDLAERLSRFVDAAWEHYQSDVFLASVEITFWHRNNGLAIDGDIAGDAGRTTARTREMACKVLEGTDGDVDGLMAATEYMHCVLTGLAFQKILVGEASQVALHLAQCKQVMVSMVSRSPDGRGRTG